MIEVRLGGGPSTLTRLVLPSAPFTTLQVRPGRSERTAGTARDPELRE